MERGPSTKLQSSKIELRLRSLRSRRKETAGLRLNCADITITTTPFPEQFRISSASLVLGQITHKCLDGNLEWPISCCHVPRMLLQAEPPNVIGASEEGLRKRRFGADAGPQAAKLANNLKRSANLQICRCARSRSLSGWTSVPLSGIFWGAKVFPVVIHTLALHQVILKPHAHWTWISGTSRSAHRGLSLF